MACHNDALAKFRAHKRESLLQATEELLARVAASVQAGKLVGRDKIGVQVGKVDNRHKVAKHFELSITDAGFSWCRRQHAITAEAALDGLYVIPPRWMPSAWTRPSACATTRPWPTWSARSAR